MTCPRCQQEGPADANFCPECGARLAVVCVRCGTVNAPTHKFCKKCGQGLGSDSGPTEPGVQPAGQPHLAAQEVIAMPLVAKTDSAIATLFRAHVAFINTESAMIWQRSRPCLSPTR